MQATGYNRLEIQVDNKNVVDAIMNPNYWVWTSQNINRKIKIIIVQVPKIWFMNVFREENRCITTLARLSLSLVDELFTMRSSQII